MWISVESHAVRLTWWNEKVDTELTGMCLIDLDGRLHLLLVNTDEFEWFYSE